MSETRVGERRWRRRVAIGAIALVVVVGLLVWLLVATRHDTGVSWLDRVIAVVFVVGLLARVVMMVGWLRKRHPSTFGRSSLRGLEFEERRQVRLAVFGGADVRPELREVAERAAHRMVRLGAWLWVCAGVGVLEIVNGVFLHEGRSRFFVVFVGVSFLLNTYQLFVQVKHAREAEQRFR